MIKTPKSTDSKTILSLESDDATVKKISQPPKTQKEKYATLFPRKNATDKLQTTINNDELATRIQLDSTTPSSSVITEEENFSDTPDSDALKRYAALFPHKNTTDKPRTIINNDDKSATRIELNSTISSISKPTEEENFSDTPNQEELKRYAKLFPHKNKPTPISSTTPTTSLNNKANTTTKKLTIFHRLNEFREKGDIFYKNMNALHNVLQKFVTENIIKNPVLKNQLQEKLATMFVFLPFAEKMWGKKHELNPNDFLVHNPNFPVIRAAVDDFSNLFEQPSFVNFMYDLVTYAKNFKELADIIAKIELSPQAVAILSNCAKNSSIQVMESNDQTTVLTDRTNTNSPRDWFANITNFPIKFQTNHTDLVEGVAKDVKAIGQPLQDYVSRTHINAIKIRFITLVTQQSSIGKEMHPGFYTWLDNNLMKIPRPTLEAIFRQIRTDVSKFGEIFKPGTSSKNIVKQLQSIGISLSETEVKNIKQTWFKTELEKIPNKNLANLLLSRLNNGEIKHKEEGILSKIFGIPHRHTIDIVRDIKKNTTGNVIDRNLLNPLLKELGVENLTKEDIGKIYTQAPPIGEMNVLKEFWIVNHNFYENKKNLCDALHELLNTNTLPQKDKVQVRSFLSSIEQILPQTKKFFGDLASRLAEPPSEGAKNICNIFSGKEFIQYGALIKSYAEKLPELEKLIKELNLSPKADIILTKYKEKVTYAGNSKSWFQSEIISIVQNLPRSQLLLNEITKAKNIPLSSEEINKLSASKLLCSIINSINNGKFTLEPHFQDWLFKEENTLKVFKAGCSTLEANLKPDQVTLLLKNKIQTINELLTGKISITTHKEHLQLFNELGINQDNITQMFTTAPTASRQSTAGFAAVTGATVGFMLGGPVGAILLSLGGAVAGAAAEKVANFLDARKRSNEEHDAAATIPVNAKPQDISLSTKAIQARGGGGLFSATPTQPATKAAADYNPGRDFPDLPPRATTPSADTVIEKDDSPPRLGM